MVKNTGRFIEKVNPDTCGKAQGEEGREGCKKRRWLSCGVDICVWEARDAPWLTYVGTVKECGVQQHRLRSQVMMGKK